MSTKISITFIALLVGGCASQPFVASYPAYQPYYSRQQLDDLDWRLRMQELDRGFEEIERIRQHRELMDKLDALGPQ